MGKIQKVGQVQTPEGVRRQVRALGAAWAQLYKVRPALVADEYRAFKAWHSNVLASPLSQWFASGTLSELDTWKARYTDAWERVQKAIGAEPMAPRPKAIKPPDGEWPWYAWVGLAAIAAYVYSLASKGR